MPKHSYQVAIVSTEGASRSSHRGYLQIAESEDLSGLADEQIIREAVITAYPEAIEYLPVRMPNRQYDRMERKRLQRNFMDRLADACIAMQLTASEYPILKDNTNDWEAS